MAGLTKIGFESVQRLCDQSLGFEGCEGNSQNARATHLIEVKSRGKGLHFTYEQKRDCHHATQLSILD